MSLIPGYAKGSNITLFNTMYQGKYKDNDGKIKKDFLMLFYKDLNTGEKKVHTIYEPTYTFYRIKEEFTDSYNRLFIDKNKCDAIEVKYSDMLHEIAKITGNLDFFYNNISTGNSSSNRRLHTLNDIMFSDMDIEDYYRFLFAQEYKNDSFRLKKAFLDIETDGRYQKGDFPEMGECPINAVSMIDEASNKCYVFLLRNKENPLIEKFEKGINKSFFDKLKNFLIDNVGGWKKAKKFGLFDIQFQIMFFDEEIELINSIFQWIRLLSPDILEIWNMAFDLEYIIQRIIALGYDPKEIICDERIKEKVLKYYIDERNRDKFAERCDFANISMFTIFLDQMIQFASRRKGRSQFTSFKLDSIGKEIAKVKKVDYSHITTNIAEFPYLNYELFVIYNIFDTCVQKCIEIKTNDLEYIFNKCLVNNTRYSKGHRQSVYLANRFAKEFYLDDYIIGNNVNRWNPKPPKFPGAMVGDPTHTNDYAKMIINGRASMIAENLMDYDYKSLYPSITIENNMSPNTQIGMIIIPDKVYNNENSVGRDPYSRSGEYIDNLISGNIIEFCKRYFHLAGYEDMINDLFEYFSIKGNISSAPLNWFDDNGRYTAIYESNDCNKYNAIVIDDGDWKLKAVMNYGKYNYNGKDYIDLLNDLKKVAVI